MASLLHTLQEMPKPDRFVLANAWGLEGDFEDDDDLIKTLNKAMISPTRAERVLEGLGDRERSALQLLLSQMKAGASSSKAASGRGAGEAKMPESSFRPLYGAVRTLGADQLMKLQPLEKPANIAEALYFRGLIGLGYESADMGARRIVYIPNEMIQIVSSYANYQEQYEEDEEDHDEDEDADEEAVTFTPVTAPVPKAPEAPPEPPAKVKTTAKTKTAGKAEPPSLATSLAPEKAAPKADTKTEGKRAAKAVPPEPEPIPDTVEPLENFIAIERADTSIVDDMTTLLAFLTLYQPMLENGMLGQEARDLLYPNLIVRDFERLRFMLLLGVAAGMVEIQGGRSLTQRNEARRWLSAPRSEQVRALANAWRESGIFDMQYVPGLRVETQAGALSQYDPVAVRKAILAWVQRAVPKDRWWRLSDFIAVLRAHDAAFQRPNGDFNVWYIANDEDEPLNGIENWDAVEGAFLEYLVLRPLHWLGMIDVGDDAAGLNAYGRAFIDGTRFPNLPDPSETFALDNTGVIQVSRRYARADRYQIARFTTWGGYQPDDAGGCYYYRLDAASIQRAAENNITPAHISGFLTRGQNEQPLPPAVVQLLENWKGGAKTTAAVERVYVLRTTSPETMTFIYDTPALRRYMGARLGDMAGVVLPSGREGLREALGTHGVQVELIGEH